MQEIFKNFWHAGNFREFVEIRENRKHFLQAKICCSTVLVYTLLL